MLLCQFKKKLYKIYNYVYRANIPPDIVTTFIRLFMELKSKFLDSLSPSVKARNYIFESFFTATN